MHAAASPVRAEVPGMPEEFTGPVAYADRWLWIAIVLLVVVVVYYLAAWWLTREPRPPVVKAAVVDVPDVRQAHLARIDALAERVHRGETSPREGHQQLSDLVRSYVAEVTTLPARTMTLTDLQHRAPAELVAAIALMYPPEFAPESDTADRFDEALAASRRLVGSWT